jgi:hypothetical protein
MTIKGYPVGSGYMGYVESENDYHLFETDGAYTEYIRDTEEESD